MNAELHEHESTAHAAWARSGAEWELVHVYPSGAACTSVYCSEDSYAAVPREVSIGDDGALVLGDYPDDYDDDIFSVKRSGPKPVTGDPRWARSYAAARSMHARVVYELELHAMAMDVVAGRAKKRLPVGALDRMLAEELARVRGAE